MGNTILINQILVYITEDSNLLYWKEELLRKPINVKIILRYMREDSKASVCRAYTIGN